MKEKRLILLGAIAGDVIGSVYEHARQKEWDFPLFNRRSRVTDDSVLTVAVAEAILQGDDYAAAIRSWGRRYPKPGMGAFSGSGCTTKPPGHITALAMGRRCASARWDVRSRAWKRRWRRRSAARR